MSGAETPQIPEYSPEDLETLARATLAQMQGMMAQLIKDSLGNITSDQVPMFIAVSGGLAQSISALAMARCHLVLNSAVSLAQAFQKE